MDIASKSIAALQQVSAKAQAGAKSPDAAEKVSKEFEAVFLTEVIDEHAWITEECRLLHRLEGFLMVANARIHATRRMPWRLRASWSRS